MSRRPAPAATALARARLQQLRGLAGVAGASPTAEPLAEPADRLDPGEAADPASAPVDRWALGPSARARAGRLSVRWSSWVEAFVPASLRTARVDPGRRAVAAMAVVVILAAAAAGVGVWRARPRAVEVTAPPVPVTPSAARSSGPSVVVAVAGGVRRPGVLTLPSGARVADAIKAAGGMRPGVDVGLLNLARRLVDGEQVVVGASAAPAPAAGSGGAPGAPLSLNTATAEQLDALPGVGPVLAARIVTYRTTHGGFRSVDQLREVTGIGEAKFADLKALVSV